jgi:hypothetical protein
VPGLGFSRLAGPSAADTKIHPRDTFAALPARSSRYEYLRDVQREVLDGWFGRRAERDLVIKTNTGNGKTLVGLMLLKSALNEHAGPAAYLTPDPVYLVNQVEVAARDLGLSTSRDPRDPAVASGSAILLATVKTLFNGRSKFGVAAEGRNIKLGTACLATVEEQFEVRLPAGHPAYGPATGPVRAVAAATAARVPAPAEGRRPVRGHARPAVGLVRPAGPGPADPAPAPRRRPPVSSFR